MVSVTPISHQIWDMKYRHKAADGTPIDNTVEDSWRRVARAAAAPEAEEQREHWAERFFAAMADFKFLPAGRILAGAGTDRRVTLFNCFVMGVIPDDLAGIFEHLKEAALTMQQGGGIGYDFSTLRPKGAPVQGVGADASGPLSFMDVWDAMCRTIMSAGHRRGAMMATMRCDHPDIEDFIAAKQDPGRLRMFNLSVLVTDAFMRALAEDGPWDLVFGGRVYKTVAARALWDRIMHATYAYAEPGVIFIDRINARNTLSYCETISATNPCITAETWIATAEGPRQVAELVGRSFTALVNGVPYASGPDGFFLTGRKPVLRLATEQGHVVRLTADHPVRRVRHHREVEWVKAGALRPGDHILLHDHRAAPDWSGPYSEGQGYLIGLLIGDGMLRADKAVLSAWPGALAVNGGYERPGVAAVMDAAFAAARALSHRADFTGWTAVPGRGEYRLALGALKALAHELGLAPGHRAITPAIEAASAAFCRGVLRGLFDADGSVQGSQGKGVSVRLAQSDLETLRAVQRMLLRFGIVSQLHADRRLAGFSRLPDGRGGWKSYATAAQHELIVSNDNLVRFAERIGFADREKAARLRSALASSRRALNSERFTATVHEIVPDGVEDVFDVEIPGINAFDANGLYVHNCGEQPLPPYGACLLGSLNLARLVEHPFQPDAHIPEERLSELAAVAVRFLDNVIDISNFPLPAQRHEAQAKRRIGLGVTGLADALLMCRARYGAPQAIALTERWLACIQRAAYAASSALAAEKGPFPLFERAAYLEAETVRGLDADLRAAIAEKGMRNGLLTSIAPTGTISLFADNVSSGIEPVFSYSYRRKLLMPDGSRREETVSDYAFRLYRRLFGENAELPEYFVTAQALTPDDHLRVQAAAQKYVDSSISKTINCPEDIPFEAFQDIYRKAYEMGCKGCTTYRPNEVTGAVLSAETRKAEPEAAQAELPLSPPPPRAQDIYEAGAVVYMTQPLDRPGVLPGQTYKLRWPDSEDAIYITINDIVQDGRRRPFEIFINSRNMEHYAWTVALTRMISAVFRRGGDVSFVVDELKAVFDPRGGQWVNGRYVPSLLAAIGEVIERHMIDIGFITRPEQQRIVPQQQAGTGGEAGGEMRGGMGGGMAEPAPRRRSCPRCGMPGLVHQEGCETCPSCGWSKCA